MFNPKDAGAFVDAATTQKPELVIHNGDLPATVYALRDLLATSDLLFDRGGPVRIIKPADGGMPTVEKLNKHTVVMEAHRLCQPVKMRHDGERIPMTLPERIAQMYLEMHEWKLRPLAGISTAPLLSSDGSIRTVEGYDRDTGLWFAGNVS